MARERELYAALVLIIRKRDPHGPASRENDIAGKIRDQDR
jgi:hypothetical protein